MGQQIGRNPLALCRIEAENMSTLCARWSRIPACLPVARSCAARGLVSRRGPLIDNFRGSLFLIRLGHPRDACK